MVENRYELTTPAAQLVEVARIAAPYKNRPEMLMNVVIEVQKVVPALSEQVAAVIARANGVLKLMYTFYYFYAMLSVKPHGKYIVRMCKSAPCHVRGAQEIVLALEDQLNIKMGETTEDGRFTLEYCPCLGICDVSPAIMINDKTYGDLTPDSVREIIKRYIREDV